MPARYHVRSKTAQHSPPAAGTPNAERTRRMLERAMALHRSGGRGAASTLYREIIELDSRNFDALHLLGVVTAEGGDPTAALSLMDLAIQINPTDAVARCNRGITLRTLKQLDAALASFDAAIALRPDYAEAYTHRGVVLRELQQFAAALASYDRAIAIAPTSAVAHFNRGNLLRSLAQPPDALASYDQAIAIKPDFAAAHLHRGEVLRELGRPEAALQSYELAIALCPDCAEAHLRHGNVLRDLMQLEAALASYNKALAIKADYAEAYLNRGTVLRELMHLEAALASYNQAIALRPDYAEAYANRATLRLLLADFANGWGDYEWRWRNSRGSNIRQTRRGLQRLWLGDECLSGKTILLTCEQGLGDTLQFCRYAAAVSGLGASVLLEVQEPLTSLLASLGGVSGVFAIGSNLPTFDWHCPLLSLPLAFKTRVDTIPAAEGYLRADADKVAQWRSRLGKHTRPRVGLVWSGNPQHSHDRYRSISLDKLLARLPTGAGYVSLQKDIREQNAQTLRARADVLDFSTELRDFSDTAALCKCMDLVISVDSAVAHLSGALGVPTWVLLPFHPDWRWLTERNDSPWYQSVKLFRQPSIDNWDEAIARLSGELLGSLQGFAKVEQSS